jgi:eukaryotic-like serine/threonine-protein kinase
MIEDVLFVAALEKPTGVARRAFLDEACAGDTALRRKVGLLLAADELARDILDRPPDLTPTRTPDSGDLDSTPRLAADTLFAGRFNLRQKLGEGGMGEVWVADQDDPVQRRVAVKVIRRGLDSSRMLARFEAERQALALMDHPNIAKFLDAGLTGDRPFFVMELIKGVPITRYCDDARLSPRERIELFVQVCRAVHHAHQKGIIHRDLKPSNILVALYDGRPVPKVIDFGVAKATGPRLSEHAVYTEVGTLIGTPEYMSPEQAELNNLDIDTRTDVYALGAVLYELLTGAVPFPREQLQSVGLAEMLRIIKEVDPPRPSTRLSSAATVPDAVAARRTEPRKLAAVVRGELDWIVMKALAKDRNRRYESATGLAHDLERYLTNQPVLAGPPSAGYRARKFLRRHRGAVLAAALVALALVGGAVGTTVGLFRAEKARDREVGERNRAEEALGREEAERVRAENNAGDARNREAEAKAALEFVDKYVFAAARPAGQEGGLGHDVTLRKAVEAALPFVDQGFKDQPLTEARLRMTLGKSFSYLGDDRTAADQFERAQDLYTRLRGPNHSDTISSVENLAVSYLLIGRFAEAVRLHEDALARQNFGLGSTSSNVAPPTTPTVGDAELGKYAGLLQLQEKTIAIMKAKLGIEHPKTLQQMHNLAVIYGNLHRHAAAVRLNEEVLAIRRQRLGADHEDTLKSLNNLANGYAGLRRDADALRLREEVLAIQKAKFPPGHPDTLGSIHNLANSYVATGRIADALKLHQEVLALRKDKLGPRHRETLQSMTAVAIDLADLGRNVESLKLHEEVLAMREADRGRDHFETLDGMGLVAECLLKLDRGPEAIRVIDDCLDRATGKVVRPGLIPHVMTLRLSYFEKAKNAEGCRATAEKWEQLNRSDAASLYQAARYRAVTASILRATSKSDSVAEADRAIGWLRKSVAAGFKDTARVRADKELDVLRDRADFRAALGEFGADGRNPKQ